MSNLRERDDDDEPDYPPPVDHFEMAMVTDGHGASWLVKRMTKLDPGEVSHPFPTQIMHPVGGGPWVSPEKYMLRCEESDRAEAARAAQSVTPDGNAVEIRYTCTSCGFHGDVRVTGAQGDRRLVCPHCQIGIEVWLETDPPPEDT